MIVKLEFVKKKGHKKFEPACGRFDSIDAIRCKHNKKPATVRQGITAMCFMTLMPHVLAKIRPDHERSALSAQEVYPVRAGAGLVIGSPDRGQMLSAQCTESA